MRPPQELSAWMVVSAWVAGVAIGRLGERAGLREAESWFLNGLAQTGFVSLVSDQTLLEAERILHAIADRKALYELLPYLLDPHGEGSRKSVLTRPETASTRAFKKTHGVFYTPADVATFMAKQSVQSLTDDAVPLTVFDPACGSGVFLRAVLIQLKQRHPEADLFDLACSSLYGADLDPWAVSAAAMVILVDSFDSVESRGLAPAAAWHAIRLNTVHMDTLRLDPGRPIPQDYPERLARLACRTALRAGRLPDPEGAHPPLGPVEFQAVFPEIAEGARLIIGNPPYAALGSSRNFGLLSKRFETLQAAPKLSSDIYPLFVEQMMRLTAPDAHGGAMVLPLSLAFSSGRQFVTLRQIFTRTPGRWSFCFFDREPHALFGEDVKTRNAIVLWVRQGSDSDVCISTGPLRKWRGDDRSSMLSSITFTPINVDIRPGIPKLEGTVQSEAFAQLMEKRYILELAVPHLGRTTLEKATQLENEPNVYVAPTAYNFLSVFLRPKPRLTSNKEHYTENPLHAITCSTNDEAYQVFAVLSSKFAFWWWHVHGDGFHVSKRTIATLPIGDLFDRPDTSAKLTKLGELLWNDISEVPIVSRNRGKTSLGFSAVGSPLRDEIDVLLVKSLGLPFEFIRELAKFSEGVIQAAAPPAQQHN